MRAIDAIDLARHYADLSTTQISQRMGRCDSYLSVTLSRHSCPQADTLASILDVCGYDLVVVPHGQGGKDAWKIDPLKS